MPRNDMVGHNRRLFSHGRVFLCAHDLCGGSLDALCTDDWNTDGIAGFYSSGGRIAIGSSSTEAKANRAIAAKSRMVEDVIRIRATLLLGFPRFLFFTSFTSAYGRQAITPQTFRSGQSCCAANALLRTGRSSGSKWFLRKNALFSYKPCGFALKKKYPPGEA